MLTAEQIHNACLTFRHDYGLLTKEEQAPIYAEAVAWLSAFERELPAPEKPKPLMTREQLQDLVKHTDILALRHFNALPMAEQVRAYTELVEDQKAVVREATFAWLNVIAHVYRNPSEEKP